MADTVLIGCKMPQGITLDLDRCVLISEQFGNVRVEQGKLPSVTLKGNGFRQGHEPDRSEHGYMFTAVPKAFWDAWVELHGEDHPFLASRTLIVASGQEAALKMARELETERGMFPRLLENDPRTRDTGVKVADEAPPQIRAGVGAPAKAA